jgi:myo-inositol-1(or 4)-monophosphatase
MGTPDARRRTGTAHGGDPTYAIDEVAERVVIDALEDRTDIAYFTEDAGLVVRGRPDTLFLVDPVDGTRPAAAGFETCCVSIALAPYGDGVTLGDVTYGCLVELATGMVHQARRGKGTRSDRPVAPTGAKGLPGLFWAGGFRGQPAVITAAALQDLFDVPGSEGAFFDQGSAAYSLASVASGRVDAFVDIGPDILEAVPETRELFERVGGGSVLNTTTYDTAAGYLFVREAGLPLSDGRGRPVEEVPLLDREGKASMVSSVCAATEELHAEIVAAIDRGLRRVRSLVEEAGRGPFFS